MNELEVTMVEDRGTSRNGAPLRLITLRDNQEHKSYVYWDDEMFKKEHAGWGNVQKGDVVVSGLSILKGNVLRGIPVIKPGLREQSSSTDPLSVHDCEACKTLTKGLHEHLNNVHQIKLV